MHRSPCSFSSSVRTKKFGSDQIGLGPQRLPHLLFFTEEGRITCHPSVCIYLSTLHLLHQILRFPFILSLSASVFFMFSFCQASTCLPVLLCDLKCSEDAFVILKIWSTNVKYSISELWDKLTVHWFYLWLAWSCRNVCFANASFDPPETSRKRAFQFYSFKYCIKWYTRFSEIYSNQACAL